MRDNAARDETILNAEMATAKARSASIFPAAAALFVILAIDAAVNAAYRAGKLDELELIALSVAAGLMTFAVAMTLRRTRRPAFAIGDARTALTRIPWLTAIVLAATVAIAAVQGALGPHRAMWYFWTADAVILVSVAEELFFRGALQTALNETRLGRASLFSLRYGTIVGAIVFACAHFTLIAGGVAMPRVWFEVGSALPLGLINGLIYQRTGNLWYGIFIHAAGNLAGA